MKKLTALMAGAILMMATSVMATPITGEINFFGSLNLTGGVGTTLLNSTYIDFLAGSTGVTQDVTGTYASIPTSPPINNATPVTFQDFSYSPFSSVAGLWSLSYGTNTYSFDLNSITRITETELSGSGTLHANGFDDTEGIFSLTTQNGKGNVSFSATSAVPEPGTMVLLGFGLLGLAIYGKRRMNNNQA